MILAEKTGFCFGVKRAVKMAEAALNRNKPIYSLGSIIHNKEVVRILSRKGLKVIKDISESDGGTLIISSHGLSPKASGDILRRGIRIIDTTCPFVLNAQMIARRLGGEGYTVVIVGDAGHPEVKALVDFVPEKAVVVKDKKEAAALRFGKGERLSVISQTTQSPDNFTEIVSAISRRARKKAKAFNTICKDAQKRQALARSLASRVDIMLVVGGRDSANTKRLFEVCRRILKRTYLIETEKDLKKEWFKLLDTVGLTSGASTPDWIIKRVLGKVDKILEGKSKK